IWFDCSRLFRLEVTCGAQLEPFMAISFGRSYRCSHRGCDSRVDEPCIPPKDNWGGIGALWHLWISSTNNQTDRGGCRCGRRDCGILEWRSRGDDRLRPDTCHDLVRLTWLVEG